MAPGTADAALARAPLRAAGDLRPRASGAPGRPLRRPREQVGQAFTLIEPFDGLRTHQGERAAFTLIELLVVVAIIALLLTLLMPTLNRGRELARQAVCRTNLRNFGVVAIFFSGEHDGVLPMAYRWNQWGMRLYSAIRVHQEAGGQEWYLYGNSEHYANTVDEFKLVGPARQKNIYSWSQPIWRRFGTTLRTYQMYGLVEGMTVCPSGAGRRILAETAGDNGGALPGEIATSGGAAYAGWRLYSSYLVVSGLEGRDMYDCPGGMPGAEWRYRWNDPAFDIPPPAVTGADDEASKRLVACDRVYIPGWRGGPQEWNHFGSDDACPGFQALLYGDGHVGANPEGFYGQPVSIDFASVLDCDEGFTWTP
jgi:prepilin-type N-terminal cleavage/methylation domain-containing protein